MSRMTRVWNKTSDDRYDATDGAVVRYDMAAWLMAARATAEHRCWIAFSPGKEEHNYLGFYRRNSRMRIPRKYKTAEAAMQAVDKAFPSKRKQRSRSGT
jgi:hypothetical protein